MRLVKFRVLKFRSITEPTDWIEVDDLNCFVGLNEAGKSNILLALWKFNPANMTYDQRFRFDIFRDYPRGEDIDSENYPTQCKEAFIESIFEVKEEDINSMAEYEYSVASNQTLQRDLLNGIRISANHQKDKNFFLTTDGHAVELTANKFGSSLLNAIESCLPQFAYYAEYMKIDTTLDLEQINKNFQDEESLNSKELEKNRVEQAFFSYLGLAPEDFLTDNKNPYENMRLSAKKRAAEERLSQAFAKWLPEGGYKFTFEVLNKNLTIMVSDQKQPIPTLLEERSLGMQWLFNFFLLLTAEGKNDKKTILLLDEPDLHLHPHAQNSLVSVFKALSQKNQLLYTTHSPFLVDHNQLHKVRAVSIENGSTRIANDISKCSGESMIQPVNAAIGLTVSQGLLLGCDIVIVEGQCDQLYLNMIKSHLIFQSEFKLQKDLLFIPAAGAANVKAIVSIVCGKTGDLPLCVLDADETGRKFQEQLKKNLYKNDQNKIIDIKSLTKIDDSEIEDLIPSQLIIASFNALAEIKEQLTEIEENEAIIPQLKNFAKEKGYMLPSGWKFQLAQDVVKTLNSQEVFQVSPELLESWKSLFDKIESLSMSKETQPA